MDSSISISVQLFMIKNYDLYSLKHISMFWIMCMKFDFLI